MSTEDFYHDDVEALEAPIESPDEAYDQQGAQPSSERFDEDDQQSFDEQPVSAALQSLALDLTLRCGALKLSLGELQRLGAGTVIEVSGIAPGHATLCHGERVVAEGELVDVDGRLGLQITRLATPA